MAKRKGKRKGRAWGPGNPLYDWQQRNGMKPGRKSRGGGGSSSRSAPRKKRTTLKTVVKVVATGAILYVSGKDVAADYKRGRAAGWSEIDSGIYAATGVRKASAQLTNKNLQANRMDWDVTAKRVGQGIAFYGTPKAIDGLAKRLPADIKRAKIPLIGMPIATA